MNYIKRHWQGKQGLAWSFWVNLISLTVIVYYLEGITRPPVVNGEMQVGIAAAVFTIITRLVVYPWQVVGTLRACDNAVRAGMDRIWAVCVQGVLVLSLVAALIMSFSTYQWLQGYKQFLNPSRGYVVIPRYSLEIVGEGKLLYIQGPLESGITRRVEELVTANPSIKGLILDSGGGQIAEGRGLARVIRENQLDTYTLGDCMSACTIAFAAGLIRTLGENARLGFHQYQAFTVYPKFDTRQEQEKEIKFFREQGITDTFLDQVFSHPPEEMWWPSRELLKETHFIHRDGYRLEDDS